MELFINQLSSSIATILAMLLLPLIWWLVTARKEQNFFSWIGLKRIQTEKKTTLLLWFLGAAAAFGLTSLLLPWITKGTEAALATARFSGLSWSALPAVTVYAFLSTAFLGGVPVPRISAQAPCPPLRLSGRKCRAGGRFRVDARRDVFRLRRRTACAFGYASDRVDWLGTWVSQRKAGGRLHLPELGDPCAEQPDRRNVCGAPAYVNHRLRSERTRKRA